MVSPLHKHFRAVTAKSFERYGFAYAEILGRWREIAGADIAAFSAPERIRWPRSRGADTAKSRRKQGGVLVIRVTDGRAVELQHQTGQIIDRVNTYYGYEAVTGIKLVHGPLPEQKVTAPVRKELNAEQEADLAMSVAQIEDQELRGALVRLGRGMLGKVKADPAS